MAARNFEWAASIDGFRDEKGRRLGPFVRHPPVLQNVRLNEHGVSDFCWNHQEGGVTFWEQIVSTRRPNAMIGVELKIHKVGVVTFEYSIIWRIRANAKHKQHSVCSAAQ